MNDESIYVMKIVSNHASFQLYPFEIKNGKWNLFGDGIAVSSEVVTTNITMKVGLHGTIFDPIFTYKL